MATSEEVYRQAPERLHKTLGAYFTVKAWVLKVDAVAIDRKSLLKFLKLSKMKNTRIDWLKEDLKDFFPYHWATFSRGTKTYSTLYLSRFPFPVEATTGYMNNQNRIEKFKKYGLKSAIAKVPQEKDMIAAMALLSKGIASPEDL